MAMNFFRVDTRKYEAMVDTDLLPDIALQFARFITSLADNPSNGLYLGAALASFVTEHGHICLDLGQAEGRPFCDEYGRYVCHCPAIKTWKKELLESGVVGRPGDFAPLILDDHGRLYLHRYWRYENSLAAHINQRGKQRLFLHDSGLLGNLLQRYFPSLAFEEMDWQALAAFTSMVKTLCIISGGPGTGKTTTVCKIISIALELYAHKEMKIALAAPTGKAAARLEEAMKLHRDRLPASDGIKARIPVEASTIHRLLGYRQDSPYFLHNKHNPLAVDMVIIDEASMVDLPLMSKLFDAVPREAPIILLGDRDQLASVEAGAVLGDLCNNEAVEHFSTPYRKAFESVTGKRLNMHEPDGSDEGFQDCVVQLAKNYRFGPQSGIGRLARAINEGDAHGVMQILKEPRLNDVSWYDLPHHRGLLSALGSFIERGYGPFAETEHIHEGFLLFEKFRILCAIRQGPYGVANLNLLVEKVLGRQEAAGHKSALYPGTPLLITRNDYTLGIYNGDIGIVATGKEASGRQAVLFRNPDGSFREIHPSRLPEFEIAYAMSIHKAQGSEFDEVMIILPDTDVPILTRELIYTAVTRARRRVTLWARPEILRAAVSRRIHRYSGLREAIA
ncbi:MAG: exodeoxyribonuclease V subunit alpha [Deltaproteobacteria bacterium]|nr:MAG: exodeoxyribonuclease V subunit alpha [Deltaproteobacteria bacterium]